MTSEATPTRGRYQRASLSCEGGGAQHSVDGVFQTEATGDVFDQICLKSLVGGNESSRHIWPAKQVRSDVD